MDLSALESLKIGENMFGISLKAYALSAACLFAASAAYYMTPRNELAQVLPAINLKEQVPVRIGEWTLDPSQIQVIENPEQSALLKSIYSDLMSRTYVNKSGERMMLSLAYGRKQGDQVGVHYPEVCYPAQGFKISEKKLAAIAVAGQKTNVTRLLAGRDGRNESITYTVLVGDRLVGSGREVKIEQLKNGFRGYISDGLLIRVSMLEPAGTKYSDAKWVEQAEFLDMFFKSVDGGLGARLKTGWSGNSVALLN